MRHLAIPAASLLLIVTTGLAHGLWSSRWSQSPELLEAVERVDRVPASFGGWEGKEQALSQAMLKLAEIDGHVCRRYQDAEGNEFLVLLVCGRPGPISLHTPDVCYEGAGYRAQADPAALVLEDEGKGRPAVFQSARFVGQGSVLGNVLDICWSWNDGRGWEAPPVPRVHFGASPYLYKLYVIRAARPSDGAEVAPGRDAFLRRLLAELDDKLAPEGR
jgi:hypothetical protein